MNLGRETKDPLVSFSRLLRTSSKLGHLKDPRSTSVPIDYTRKIDTNF